MSLIKCCFDAETELLDTVVQCNAPACCCGCCQALRPRYKRLVDNIFPVLPQDGLVKSAMERLTFYAVSSPEKLDRIGEYLYQKAGRDIYRRRYKLVTIAMEAMDLLLIACHAHTLNLYVESFLKMVQKLLESQEPELQIMATQSFVRFANIEEDQPMYHLKYDFFVSKFSSMCHNNDDDRNVRNALRLAGIKGLQGVVRKTVSDDLVENIWEPVHMDKIVPSLLYNMQNGPHYSDETDRRANENLEVETPPNLSESCLRELVSRASFGHIRSVLRPLLRHLDNHQLWLPNTFAIHTFKLIMSSVQAHFRHAAVESLMSHLDENSNPKIKTSIADVLSKIIALAAGESVGPSVLEIINSLLNHLRTSVPSPGRMKAQDADEMLYQEALINALGEFANHLPDYQKIEIMMFIVSKIPYPIRQTDYDSSELLLENILLKSLLKVSTNYQTHQFNSTFPPSFLDPLLRMSMAPDPGMRILVQNILHTLIDRHGNLSKLNKPTVEIESLDLKLVKPGRPDIIFIRKYGPEIFTSLYECLELPNNTIENVETVFTTMALLTVELLSEETILDLTRLLLSIQDMTLVSTSLSATQKAHLHAIVTSVFSLIPRVVQIQPLIDYADGIVECRRKELPHLLPPLRTVSDISPSTPLPPALLDLPAITQCLQDAGLDVQRLLQAPGYVGLTHRHSWVDSSLHTSNGEINAEVDSITSSPGFQKKHVEETLTFESMKKILSETVESRKAAEDEKRQKINQMYKTATFQQLLQRNLQNDEDVLRNNLHDILSRYTQKEPTSPVESRKAPVYETLFPELFIY